MEQKLQLLQEAKDQIAPTVLESFKQRPIEELVCAAVLVNLSVSKPPEHNDKIIYKVSSRGLIGQQRISCHGRFKRNINACRDHKHKHQKCPVTCPKRDENAKYAESIISKITIEEPKLPQNSSKEQEDLIYLLKDSSLKDEKGSHKIIVPISTYIKYNNN
jgi:hypothetical protein